jgi:hypothetical protein
MPDNGKIANHVHESISCFHFGFYLKNLHVLVDRLGDAKILLLKVPEQCITRVESRRDTFR